MKHYLLVNLMAAASLSMFIVSCQKEKKQTQAVTPASAPKTIIARIANDQVSRSSTSSDVKVDLVASQESLKNADAATVEKAFIHGSPMNLEGEGKGVKALTDETGHAFALNGCQGYNAPIGTFNHNQGSIGIGIHNQNPVMRFLNAIINITMSIEVFLSRIFMPIGFPYAQGGIQVGCGYSHPQMGSQPQYYTQPHAQQNPQPYYDQYYQPYNPYIQPGYGQQPQPGMPQPGNQQPVPIPPVPGQAVQGQPPFTPAVYSQNMPGQPYAPGYGPTPYPYMNQYQHGNYIYYTYGAQNINPQGSQQVIVPGQGPQGPQGPQNQHGQGAPQPVPQPVPPHYQQQNNGTTPNTYPQTGYNPYTYNPGTAQHTYGPYSSSN